MMPRNNVLKAAGLAAIAFALAAPGAIAGDSVSVGKAVPFAWTFTPLDVGSQMGVFKKHGIDNVKIVGFRGDANLQQGLLTKNIDFGLGSGPGMAFNAKGGAGLSTAAWYGAPYNLGISVPYDSKFTKAEQFKGKKLGVTTVGSLTDWLTRRLSQHMGWGTTGITPVALGGLNSELSGLKTGNVDGLVIATEVSYDLEAKKELKQVYNFADLVPNFITHVIFARKDLIKSNPDLVRRFTAGYLDSIKYVLSHKKETVEITSKVLKMPPAIISRVYDEETKGFHPTGSFDPKSIALLKQTYLEMGLLKDTPKDSDLFTTEFLPKM
jgi:ABC-type nitrate/sulfonate/bicarbonate transport system substrate-binding protein